MTAVAALGAHARAQCAKREAWLAKEPGHRGVIPPCGVAFVLDSLFQHARVLDDNFPQTEISGELTGPSWAKVLGWLTSRCGLNSSSVFVDLGSGRNTPCLGAAAIVGCIVGGFEVQPQRTQLAVQCTAAGWKQLAVLAGGLAPAARFWVELADLENVELLHAGGALATIAYAFDKGMIPAVLAAMAEAANYTDTLEWYCSYMPDMVEQHGLMATRRSSMQVAQAQCRTSSSHTVYFYEMNAPRPCSPCCAPTLSDAARHGFSLDRCGRVVQLDGGHLCSAALDLGRRKRKRPVRFGHDDGGGDSD